MYKLTHSRLLASLLITLAAVQMPAMAQDIAQNAAQNTASDEGQIQHYQRKYISFFYPQDYPLNRALANAFSRGFPRFDYHLADTAMNMSFQDFISQTHEYEQQVAGDIAAGREVPDPRFGDKVVSWSETQKIAKAAYVFVPIWDFSEIEIEGPFATDTKNPKSGEWSFNAEADVSLDMGLWSLAGDSAVRKNEVHSSWNATRKNIYRVSASEVIDAANRYNQGKSASDQINLDKSLSSSERDSLLDELREIAYINNSLKAVESQEPTVYMMSTAVDAVGYGSVISSIQRMDEFLIRAEVSEPDMKKDRVTISLAEGETPTSLGIGLDSGYKILEYVQGGSPREVGYVKIRELGLDDLISQPIIVGRDFELGDQVVEYPKAGIGFNLRGGIMASSSFNALSGGGGALDIDFNVGPVFGASEIYFLLSGGFYNGYGLAELGIQKKWFMRQLIIALGLRGGGSFAENNNGGGVTGMLGLHWQATPDFAFGIDTGWRQYSQFGGPLLEGFVRFEL
jgi:hypothetical protein